MTKRKDWKRCADGVPAWRLYESTNWWRAMSPDHQAIWRKMLTPQDDGVDPDSGRLTVTDHA